MTVTTGLAVLNGLLALALNSQMMAQRISSVLEKAQAAGGDIPDEEWQKIISEADAADARLAEVIREKSHQS